MSENESSLPNNTDISMEVIESTNEVLKNLFLNKKWTDFTITFGSKSFSVHRCIVCSAMPYFDTMMSSEFDESYQDHVTLHAPIDIEAFECLIKWAYSFKMNINLTNIRCLLEASDYLNVNQVFRDCCEYLDSVLNIETALEIKEIIKHLEVGKLANKVTTLITVNFAIISKSEKWFELPIEKLNKYIKNDDAIGFNENEIGEAILRWVEYKPDSRQEHLTSLLKLIKWEFLDPTIMVKKIASHKLVRSNESCRELLFGVFKFMMFQRTESSLTSNWKSPRIHKFNAEILMGFKRSSDKLQCFVQLPYSDEWKWWTTLEIKCSNDLRVAATDDYLLFYSNRGLAFVHLPSKTLQMTVSEHVHSVTASSDEFFITESFNDDDDDDDQPYHIIKSIKYVSSNRNESDVATMSHVTEYRFVYLNNALYFIGGDTKSTKFQKYDIAQSKWTLLTPMSTSRKSPHVAALNGKIYVVGGVPKYNKYHSHLEASSPAEYYDPNLNKWFNIPFPKYENDVKFLIAYCSKLYAFMDRHLSLIYIYDPKTGKWKTESVVSRYDDFSSVISIPNFNGQQLSYLVDKTF